MKAPNILQINRTVINELLTDITKLVHAYHVDKDSPNNNEMYESIKYRIQGMTDVIFSYNPILSIRGLITNPSDPKYNPIDVFNNVILPIYKSGGFVEKLDPVNDEALEKLRSRIIDKCGLLSTNMVLEIYPKWSKHISLEYHYGYTHPENGDASFPVIGLSGNLQCMLFSNYISSIFPNKDIYAYLYKDEYNKNTEMHLALRNSSDILSDEEEDYLDEDEYDLEPYLRYKDDVPTRLADAVYTILKNTKVTSILNRYTLPF